MIASFVHTNGSIYIDGLASYGFISSNQDFSRGCTLYVYKFQEFQKLNVIV